MWIPLKCSVQVIHVLDLIFLHFLLELLDPSVGFSLEQQSFVVALKQLIRGVLRRILHSTAPEMRNVSRQLVEHCGALVPKQVRATSTTGI
jgi:hypothetical protein